MQKASGLGRGLGSLIPNKKATKELLGSSPVVDLLDSDEKIVQIPIDKIIPNPHQPRTHFDKDALDDLVSSIKEHGVIQPIIVSKVAIPLYPAIVMIVARVIPFSTVANGGVESFPPVTMNKFSPVQSATNPRGSRNTASS